MTLRLSRQSVRPEDFTGSRGVCQNLDCLAPLEEPYTLVAIQTPGGRLDTVLCCNCAPADDQERLKVKLVEDPPVLELP